MNQTYPNAGKRVLPVWRSLLIFPVTSEKFVSTAHKRGADALILDLEDSIAPSRKDEARACVATAAEIVGRSGADVLVRINSPWRLAIRDLEAVVSPRIYGLVLPKVTNAHHIHVLSEVVAELERERGMEPGTTKFIALVETAQAYSRMEEIANADPRLIAMGVGAEDFSASCGMEPDADGLFVPKMQMLILARAAGILPLGNIYSIADYSDLEGLRNAAMRARRLGFMAVICIHPAQLAVINEAYSPTSQEVEYARRVTAAAASAEAAGVGAYEVDGKMIDPPVVERARTILTRHDAIQSVNRRIGT